MRNNSVKYLEFGPEVQEMPFKDIFYLELWRPFCSVQRNHLCTFGRGYQEEQFCEIILNLDQWFRRRCLLKTFLIWRSGGPFVQRSTTIATCNFGRGHYEEQFCYLFRIWASGSGDVVYKISYLELRLPSCSAERN